MAQSYINGNKPLPKKPGTPNTPPVVATDLQGNTYSGDQVKTAIASATPGGGPNSGFAGVSGVQSTQPTAPPPPAAKPVAPVASTAAPVALTAEEQYLKDEAVSEEWAKKQLADGSLGTISDPRQAQMNAYLADLYNRTKGMNSAEMLAAQEQGAASINQGAARDMRRLGQMAGSAGVRGGAAMGMQAGALRNAAQNKAAYQRQLVLDNIAQQNQAFGTYGDALTGQQNTELGIQSADLALRNKEKLGRLDLAIGRAGTIDSRRAGAIANAQAERNSSIAQKSYDDIMKLLAKQAAAKGGDGTYQEGDTYNWADRYKSTRRKSNPKSGKEVDTYPDQEAVPGVKFY